VVVVGDVLGEEPSQMAVAENHDVVEEPDGAEVELVPVDEMTEAERRSLEQALAESEDDVKAGLVYSAADVLADLRRQ
jgi:hypothetical protein